MNYLDLPVYQHKDLILAALEKSQAIVVESPTGSGKTTQLPVILHDAGYGGHGIIGVTQPRRIAALSVSGFIARQLGFAEPGAPGCPIGYKMRFEDRTGPSTKIKIMTDGILLQEMKLDPWLSRYGVMLIDEAHERSLNIDFILGLLKRVLEERPEFKVIVSSATINAEVFSEYFGECPVVKIDAQTFPVTLVYDPPVVGPSPDTFSRRHRHLLANGAGTERENQGAEARRENQGAEARRENQGAEKRKETIGNPRASLPPREDTNHKNFSESAQDALLDKIDGIVERVVSEKRKGDVLIFLSGEKMIKDCVKRLVFGRAGRYLHILPLYGRLGREEQERIFDEPPGGKIKVVISTNIAETSVTIDGITTVIDSGLSKLNYYNPKTYTSSLVEAPVSRASANQRKGRAGRTREGTCYRLYSRKDFENKPLFTTEEIYRTDLSEVVLRMADLGLTDYEGFDFISQPGREGIAAAIETLNLLDALDEDRGLSKTGKLMTEFPLAPRHSRIIVEAILRYPDVLEETLVAAAFLSTQSPYLLPPGEETDARKAHHGFRDPHGDFVSYLKLYRAYGESVNKAGFCEKNYLDERAMAEIANVTSQLAEIVSAMKIPVLSGGPVEDYLCCVGRGLIQFVCVREGRETYRSLTAGRIMIHPGSVMWGHGRAARDGRGERGREPREEPPRYIVAGEIIRTTRMYAMSVSPLSFETLERISPILLEKLGSGEGAEEGRRDRASERSRGRGRAEEAGLDTGAGKGRAGRDFTNNVRIGSALFPLETFKGKKRVRLSWADLAKVKEEFEGRTIDLDRYRGLRGAVIFNETYSLLAGEKLSLILTLLPALDLEGALTREWPRKETFYSGDAASRARLIENLPLALNAALSKSGRGNGRPRRGRNGFALPSMAKQTTEFAQQTPHLQSAAIHGGGGGGELGFIGLFTNGTGGYWFRCSRGFHTALNESIAGLEALIDELGEDVDLDQKNVVNQTYRRLSDVLGG